MTGPTPFQHTPVLSDETMGALRVVPGGRYGDGTVGGGGHALEFLQRSSPDGVLIGLDRDPAALAACAERLRPFGDRVILERANFSELLPTLARIGMVPLDGILLDLGVSSHQLDTAGRGFSFASSGPLDMRMDPDGPTTAAQLIEELSEAELSRVLRRFGEEPRSRKIACAIKDASRSGKLHSTLELAAVVSAVVGDGGGRRMRIHPATRTFQAIRIAVNDELGALERFLEGFCSLLRPGGRVAIISFHSLEDRMVKRQFAQLANPCTCPPDLPTCACGLKPSLRLVNRRAIKARNAEIERNPRARSARLRAAERI